jgi:hypothetical protein
MRGKAKLAYVRPVCRRHMRARIASIKWSKILARDGGHSLPSSFFSMDGMLRD